MSDAIIVTVEGVRTRASTSEAIVSFSVPLEQAALVSGFMSLIGKQVGIAFAEVGMQNENGGGESQWHEDTHVCKANNTSTAVTITGPNLIARDMHKLGYFRNPNLWNALEVHGLYTQANHKNYLEGLTCDLAAYSPCSGDVVVHHCRTAANAGIGIKPPHWYGVPLCGLHHSVAHSKSFIRTQHESLMQDAVAIMASRAKIICKQYLGIGSLSEITEDMKAKLDGLWK